MMKTFALAALAGSAAAFAPSPAALSRTALAADFSGEVGAMEPLGFFDPLGLLKDADQSTFDRLRETELKHGRLCMAAFVGYIATYAGLRFPGAEDIPSGLGAWEALAKDPAGVQVLGQMALAFAMFEAANQDQWKLNPDLEGESPAEFAGDYRNGFFDLGWDQLSDEKKIQKRTIELNNGRAAMMGILGLVVHEQMGNLDAILPSL